MNVKVNMAGQEIEVPVTPEQEVDLRKQYEIQFMSNFFRDSSQNIRYSACFTTSETDLLVDELHHAYTNLKEVCSAIALDKYLTQVQELADGIVSERSKIYRVTVRYEGEFDVLVKATDADEAEDYVNNLGYYDLADYIDRADFDVDYTREDTNADEAYVDFDATE